MFGKRCVVLFILSISLILNFSVQSPACSQDAAEVPKVTIIGSVFDSKTGEPLVGANVYIANTVLGSETNLNGNFIIFNVPYGSHKVFASYVGYEAMKRDITVSGPEVKPLGFRLKQDITQTGEVVVTETAPKNWNYNLSRFKREFIGTSKNAESCEILNPEVIDFEELEDGGFSASAKELIIIENRALGYRIELMLEEFIMRGSQIMISFIPHYTDLDPETLDQLREWEDERKRAFSGSLRHFLKSLVRETIDEEEFAFQSVQTLEVNEDPTFHLGRKQIKITPGSSVFEKNVDFDNFLLLVYHDEGEERNYYRTIDEKSHDPMTYDPTREKAKLQSHQTSYLTLRRRPVLVNSEGILKDPQSIISYGYIAWERLADQIPYDYEPAPQGTDVFPENVRPETRYFDALEEADSLGFTERFEYPLLLVLNDKEKKHYNAITTLEGRRGFVKRYIKSRNQNPLYAVNYWFLEFSGRVERARREFSIDEFPYFDVRGETWIKYGKPSVRYEDSGGFKRSSALSQNVQITEKVAIPNPNDPTGPMIIRESTSHGPLARIYNQGGLGAAPSTEFNIYPNETWYYSTRSRNFTLHFVRDHGDWREAEDMDDFLVENRRSNAEWHWMELIKDRVHVSPEYAYAIGTIERLEESLASSEVVIDRTQGAPVVMLNTQDNMGGQMSERRPNQPVVLKKNQIEHEESGNRMYLEPNISDRFRDQNALELDYDTVQFRGTGGKTRIEFVVRTSIEDLLDKRTQQDTSDSISVNYSYTLRDQLFEPVVMSETARITSVTQSESAGVKNIIAYDKAEIEAQTGDLTIQVEDNFSRNRGFLQQMIDIRDFTGSSPMMSDVLFLSAADTPGEKELLQTFEIEGVEVTPYPYESFHIGEPVFCYFELYNLNSPEFQGRYRVEISAKQKKSKAGFVKRLFGGGSKTINLSVSQDRSAAENDSKELMAVDLSKLKPGDYVFSITVNAPGKKESPLSIEKEITIVKN